VNLHAKICRFPRYDKNAKMHSITAAVIMVNLVLLPIKLINCFGTPPDTPPANNQKLKAINSND
jgi:hypothetical protein